MDCYFKPIRAVAKLSDGQSIEFPQDEAVRLHDALDSRDFWKGPPEAEEGSWIDHRSIERVGGRSEFERGRQRMIIDWLERNRVEGAPNVMIIGDSIRMRIGNGTGYIQNAYRHLIGQANLGHVPHNSGGTITGLKLIDNWVASRPDIVHYNAGLHDLALFKNKEKKPSKYTDVATYQKNVEAILNRIKAAGAKTIIWATNTPVDDEWHARRSTGTGSRTLIRKDADVERYNAASIEVATRMGIEVNDLYTPLKEAGVRKVVLPDGVHLNHFGSELAGSLVAKAVKRHL